jgi:hypothetical protein
VLVPPPVFVLPPSAVPDPACGSLVAPPLFWAAPVPEELPPFPPLWEAVFSGVGLLEQAARVNNTPAHTVVILNMAEFLGSEAGYKLGTRAASYMVC